MQAKIEMTIQGFDLGRRRWLASSWRRRTIWTTLRLSSSEGTGGLSSGTTFVGAGARAVAVRSLLIAATSCGLGTSLVGVSAFFGASSTMRRLLQHSVIAGYRIVF